MGPSRYKGLSGPVLWVWKVEEGPGSLVDGLQQRISLMVSVLALKIQGWFRPMAVDEDPSLIDHIVRDAHIPRSLTLLQVASGGRLVSLDLRELLPFLSFSLESARATKCCSSAGGLKPSV